MQQELQTSFDNVLWKIMDKISKISINTKKLDQKIQFNLPHKGETKENIMKLKSWKWKTMKKMLNTHLNKMQVVIGCKEVVRIQIKKSVLISERNQKSSFVVS